MYNHSVSKSVQKIQTNRDFAISKKVWNGKFIQINLNQLYDFWVKQYLSQVPEEEPSQKQDNYPEKTIAWREQTFRSACTHSLLYLLLQIKPGHVWEPCYYRLPSSLWNSIVQSAHKNPPVNWAPDNSTDDYSVRVYKPLWRIIGTQQILAVQKLDHSHSNRKREINKQLSIRFPVCEAGSITLFIRCVSFCDEAPHMFFYHLTDGGYSSLWTNRALLIFEI